MIVSDRLPTTLPSSDAVPGSYCAPTSTDWYTVAGALGEMGTLLPWLLLLLSGAPPGA